WVLLFFLSDAEWLPFYVAFSRPGEDRRLWSIVVAGMGLVTLIYMSLKLRADRLGTERAQKQFRAFDGLLSALFGFGIAFLLFVIGLLLWFSIESLLKQPWLLASVASDEGTLFVATNIALTAIVVVTLTISICLRNLGGLLSFRRLQSAALIFSVLAFTVMLLAVVVLGLSELREDRGIEIYVVGGVHLIFFIALAVFLLVLL